MQTNSQAGLDGLRVVSFESRRCREMAALIRNYGGEPIVAPSMREVPLDQNTAALEFIRDLQAGKVDVAIFLTGVGARTLFEAASSRYSRDQMAEALGRATLVARGPKPVAALKEIGLYPEIIVPEPNTWREILAALRKMGNLTGKRIAVQEYGITRTELMDGIKALGAEVFSVPVYKWALPEDTAQLRAAVSEIAALRADVALFTNATQVYHVFKIACADGLEQPLRGSLPQLVIASIGPVCTEALQHFGIKADIEPEHPKMGHLIAVVASRGRSLLDAKRGKKSS